MRRLFVLIALLIFGSVQAFASWYLDAGIGFSREAHSGGGVTLSFTQFSVATGIAYAPWENPIYLGATLDFGVDTVRLSGGGESWRDTSGFFGITPNVIVFPWDFLSMSAGLQFLFGEVNYIRTVAGIMKHFRISGNRFMGIGLNWSANIVNTGGDFMLFMMDDYGGFGGGFGGGGGGGISLIARFVMRPMGFARSTADNGN